MSLLLRAATLALLTIPMSIGLRQEIEGSHAHARAEAEQRPEAYDRRHER